MSTVWVVWANDYDGGQIIGVATSQEVGEQMKADYFKNNPTTLYLPRDVEVDEWDVTGNGANSGANPGDAE